MKRSPWKAAFFLSRIATESPRADISRNTVGGQFVMKPYREFESLSFRQ
jgi:hypothetical protein